MTQPTPGQDPSIIDDYLAREAAYEHIAETNQTVLEMTKTVDAILQLLTGALTDPADGHTQSVLTLARRAVNNKP